MRNDFRRNTADGHIVTERGVDHRIGTYGHVIADGDVPVEFGAGANVNIVTDDGNSIICSDASAGVDAAIFPHFRFGADNDWADMHQTEARSEDVLRYGEA